MEISTLQVLAASQGGVVTRAQAIEFGLTKGMIDQRVRSGRWDIVARGCYRVQSARDEQDLLAGALVGLPSPVVSHASAGRLLGLRGVPASDPTVTVSSRTTHEFVGVTVRRVTVAIPVDHCTKVKGLTVTSTSRTIVDLAADMQPRSWGRLAQEAVVGGLCSKEAIGRVAELVCGRGRKGSVTVREFLEDEGSGMSALERKAAELLAPLGPERQFSAPWNGLLRIDFAFPDQKLGVEVDSRRWHSTQDRFQSDRERDRDALTHGWRIVRLTWEDLTQRPGESLRLVAGLLV